MVLSLGMLGWGLRPFPMDTRDATLERPNRGQLDRAYAILEARQAAQLEVFASEPDSSQMDEDATAPRSIVSGCLVVGGSGLCRWCFGRNTFSGSPSRRSALIWNSPAGVRLPLRDT